MRICRERLRKQARLNLYVWDHGRRLGGGPGGRDAGGGAAPPLGAGLGIAAPLDRCRRQTDVLEAGGSLTVS